LQIFVGKKTLIIIVHSFGQRGRKRLWKREGGLRKSDNEWVSVCVWERKRDKLELRERHRVRRMKYRKHRERERKWSESVETERKRKN